MFLVARQEGLKASMKVQGLEIKESEEEAELKVKLLEADGNAKESTSQNKSGDPKTMEKLAKKERMILQMPKKVLEGYNKQIEKVKELGNEIRTEERKLGYKKPFVVFHYQ